ncbi:hypothetical protein PhCBS80983_g02268 [Powellomyces hirtus]|uniref:Cas1p 10 TM acyl transferase domain-containing protein n=1 Tax=Powellomyces hirtus TaxID=109895 RepID=A0A507E717_9FUNG|nr:hypothetical protein PhCBS80983_g02268 [Powellomyces hirtus]
MTDDAERLLPTPVTETPKAPRDVPQDSISKQSGFSKQQTGVKISIAAATLMVLLSVVVVLLKPRPEARFGNEDVQLCSADLANGHLIGSAGYGKAHWQTHSCFLHQYTQKEATTCFKDSRAIYVGDSTARAAYLALRNKLIPDAVNTGGKHEDQHIDGPNGISLSFYWDPFWNVTNQENPPWLEAEGPTAKKPILLTFSAGHWFMKYGGADGFKSFQNALDHVLEGVTLRHSSGVAWSTFNADGAVERVFVRPVNPVVESKLDASRKGLMTPEKVDQFNTHIFSVIGAEGRTLHDVGAPLYSAALYSVSADHTADGFHYDDSVLSHELNLQLNEICNSRLFGKNPAGKATCCVKYSEIKSQQWVTLLLFAVFGCAAWFWRHVTREGRMKGTIGGGFVTDLLEKYLPGEQTSSDLTIIGAAVFYMLLVDRTPLFLKVNKSFYLPTFILLAISTVIPGLATLATEKDTSFLNRHQTDEWKGWMQLAILVYHYTGASSITPIYAVIRVLVASYLFMTGYGHFIFFYKKNVYTFARAASILVRLNLLSAAMAYTMDKDILFYYFGPLVSFWFIFVWLTMYIGNQYNKNTPFLLMKIGVAIMVSWAIIKIPWFLENLFKLLNLVAAINWDAKESAFRLMLDHLIVFAGMLTAFTTTQLSLATITKLKPYALGASLAVIAGYSVFITITPTKFTYNAVHPYISPLVVIAFTILRNYTPSLRGSSSQFFRWVGQSSLELFLVQYHVWLAVDTKGLVVLPFGSIMGSPAVGMFVFGILFFTVATGVSGVSSRVVDWIAGSKVTKWRTVGLLGAMLIWNWAW